MEITLNLAHTDLKINWEGDPDAKLLDESHPYYLLTKTKAKTQVYLNKYRELLSDLPQGMRVQEFCGGIGLVALAVWDVLNPSSWDMIELDPSCIENHCDPRVTKHQGDIYEVTDIYGDLITMDFPNNTLPKMWREPKRNALLHRIADSKPKFWEITDVAYYWIHLPNHWPHYIGRFGMKPTKQNYHELFDRYMRDEFGYKVFRHRTTNGAQLYLMTPV